MSKIAELRKLGKEATAGPWSGHPDVGNSPNPEWIGGGDTLFDEWNDKDRRYILAARNHWEALLNIADALEAISCNLNEGEDLHYANDVLARLEAIK